MNSCLGFWRSFNVGANNIISCNDFALNYMLTQVPGRLPPVECVAVGFAYHRC